ncbi:MAG TPA: hypothetical protein VH023_19960 [Rhodopila sp.]|nr:hypothetical protein [Rhodopila sp.]
MSDAPSPAVAAAPVRMSRRAQPMPLFGPAVAGCSIVTATPIAFEGSFTVPATAAVFAGHYPGRPILPGAYLIEAGLQAVEMAMNAGPDAPLRLLAVERFRLLQKILPGCPVTLRAVRLPPMEPAAAEVNWKHEVFLGDVLAARFRLTVGPAAQTAGVEALSHAPEIGPGSVELDATAILRRLPHRWPLLLIDHARVLAAARRIATTKSISLGDPCYGDLHRSNESPSLAYPPSLILESFTQSAALLMTEVLADPVQTSALMVFGGALKISYDKEVFPGQTMSHKVLELTRYNNYALAGGLTLVGNKKIAAFEGLSVALLN